MVRNKAGGLLDLLGLWEDAIKAVESLMKQLDEVFCGPCKRARGDGGSVPQLRTPLPSLLVRISPRSFLEDNFVISLILRSFDGRGLYDSRREGYTPEVQRAPVLIPVCVRRFARISCS